MERSDRHIPRTVEPPYFLVDAWARFSQELLSEETAADAITRRFLHLILKALATARPEESEIYNQSDVLIWAVAHRDELRQAGNFEAAAATILRGVEIVRKTSRRDARHAPKTVTYTAAVEAKAADPQAHAAFRAIEDAEGGAKPSLSEILLNEDPHDATRQAILHGLRVRFLSLLSPSLRRVLIETLRLGPAYGDKKGLNEAIASRLNKDPDSVANDRNRIKRVFLTVPGVNDLVGHGRGARLRYDATLATFGRLTGLTPTADEPEERRSV